MDIRTGKMEVVDKLNYNNARYQLFLDNTGHFIGGKFLIRFLLVGEILRFNVGNVLLNGIFNFTGQAQVLP